MSLYLNFEPHSWYKGFAIRYEPTEAHHGNQWEAYTDDGNTYRVMDITARTLKELKAKITEYRNKEAK